MSLILSIETSTNVCSVALHEESLLLGAQTYAISGSHSSLLPEVIKELLAHCGKALRTLKAVALSEGPGSYTGLRIGTSTAKGLCYALDIPLITLPTLEIMIADPRIHRLAASCYLVPMIDARRMEVYALVANDTRQVLQPTAPLVLQKDSFSKFANKALVLLGNGATKCKDFLNHPAGLVILDEVVPEARNMGPMAFEKFKAKEFASTAYFEPDYLKAYQTKKAKSRLMVEDAT